MDQRQRLKENQNMATIKGVSHVYALIFIVASTFVTQMLESMRIE
jgi:hypothetical protein